MAFLNTEDKNPSGVTSSQVDLEFMLKHVSNVANADQLFNVHRGSQGPPLKERQRRKAIESPND